MRNPSVSRARYAFRALAGAGLVAVWLSPGALFGQQINLDRPVRAGELTLFPDIKEESTYYYVIDKPRLATDERGRPQFSFLRYVENVRSGATDEEIREGEGGGILHCLVSLEVTEDQRREAERALRRIDSSGEIRGPVVFRSGTFALVSSFADPQGNLSTQVLGLGNAPLLDGEKAAVSMQLTKLGAKILWESFQTPTPDISFTFEMEIEGYRAPVEATIVAEWDRVYEHQAFNVGLASSFLAAEIKGAFEELTESRAIRVEQTGTDAQIETLLSTAYNKLLEMMFSPVGGSGTPSLASLTGAAGGGQSLLDRATQMYQSNQQRADRENERIRRENREARARADAESRRREGERSASGEGSTETTEGAGGREGGGGSEGAEGAEGDAPRREVPLHARRAGVERPSRVRDADEEREGREPELQEEVSPPPFAVLATFEMKRVRQRGTFRLDLNKRTTDTMTLRFDENVGDLRRFMEDESHFRQVNLDDPLYRQREIVAMVDGYNAEDFGEFVNFVSVQMRKRHEGGDETYDEVRIDRNNFSREGNAFKLLYGFKGDQDRRRWMSYDVKSTWSFFGGAEVATEWSTTTSGAVNLAPPYQRRTIELQADPEAISEAQVRSINVKLYYELEGAEQNKQVTLNASGGELSRRVDFLLPADSYDYEYEITWRLRGNRTVSSGRQSASDSILFVDELPEG